MSNVQDPRSSTSPSEESAVVQELRRRLAEPGPWAQRFRRLVQAIAETTNLSCEEVEGVLDIYVDDELAGRDVERRHPAIWEHLQVCSACREFHDLLLDLLRVSRSGTPPAPPPDFEPDLSFLRPPTADALWVTRLRSRLDGSDFELSFTLTPSFLLVLFASPTPSPVRPDDEAPPSRQDICLLVSDVVLAGDLALAVEVFGKRDAETPDLLHVQGTIAGSAALPSPLWATLTWADQEQTVPVGAGGRIDFGTVSLEAVTEILEAGAGKFEITFQSGSVTPNTEEGCV